jgi:hypothetical protein
MYPERVKSSNPEAQYCLLDGPGSELFTTLPGGSINAIYCEPATGRVFAVAGTTLNEVFSDQTFHTYSNLDGGYYTFASNSEQVMITCAGAHTGYIFTLATNLLQKISSAGFLGADSVQMIDNYFITRLPDSRQFQISALLDGLTWDAADVAFAEGGPDNLVGDLADHKTLWLFGSRRAEVFQDTGAALFPFERLNTVYLEQGLGASKSLIQLDNTIYWLGANQHGNARVFRADGYTPIGVSNRAVEWWFSQYAKRGGISDAVAFGYQDEDGHSFYVITFPSITCEPDATSTMVDGVVNGATWVYDVTEQMWHERQYLDPATGKFGRALSTYHTFAFGKHLVGGGDATGNVYEMSTDIVTDNGNVRKRTRRAPHIVDELSVIVYSYLELSAQVGNGPVDDPNNTVVLRVSNDGGKTWSNEYPKPLGDIGEYNTIIKWKSLGRSRRRSYEVSTTVKASVCWVDAYFGARK